MTDEIIRSFDPGDTDWIVAQHASHYAREDGFDDSFGRLVAEILRDFKQSNDASCERGFVADREGERLGCVFCVRKTQSIAKLRLFYLEPQARGLGLGRRLLDQCMGFAKSAGYSGMELWTHESHKAACALYRRAGWQLVHSRPVRNFGQDLVEQHWKILL